MYKTLKKKKKKIPKYEVTKIIEIENNAIKFIKFDKAEEFLFTSNLIKFGYKIYFWTFCDHDNDIG